ncbi:MAG: murein biosynthesis integral membrane protein MurJ [Clostridiales bacterium]|nr:murein biosynthesis integral membrane protein MurJ [Clostridiales bacterium]HBM81147.1 murein biosynthesis integral membrane protein MurJ [Clostridiaceae bacterium]
MISTKNIAKYGALISIILTLSKIAGFGREFVIATFFGAGVESDVFKIATTAPNMIFSCVNAALVTMFIPVFSNVKNDREKANMLYNNIFNIILVACSFLAVLGVAGSPVIIRILASGFKGEEFRMAVSMTRIVMPSIIFLGISGILTGYLQSYGIFLQPALTGISADLIIIAGIVFFARYGIISGIIATLIGSAAQFLIQRPFMRDYKYKFYINFKDENVKKMLMLSIPILISTAANQINITVDRTFASHLAAGSISVVDNASKISSIINQVFIFSITTVLYPMLTERYNKEDKKDFIELFNKSINLIIIIAVPLILGMYVLGGPLIRILLQHGKFTKNAAELTSMCLKYLVFGALGYSLIDIMNKVFFSAKDSITPMKNGILLVCLNILFLTILVPRLGIKGLVISTISSVTISSLIMLVRFKKKLKNISYMNLLIVLSKSAFAGIIMALLVSFTYNYSGLIIKSGSLVITAFRFLASTAVGVVVYILMLRLLKVDEVKMILLFKKH